METMTALMSGVFLASLAGSLHCAGMCGGFVALYSCSSTPAQGRSWDRHAAYSLGRLVAYLVVGALFGAIGVVVNRAGDLAGVRGVATYVAGGMMVVWGSVALLRAFDLNIRVVRIPSVIMRSVAGVYASFAKRTPAQRAWLLGLSSALLPCGWLYAFAVLAAGTGGVLPGLMIMLAFWAGTLPAMLVSGVTLQTVSASVGRRIPAVSAAVLIVVGLLWLAGMATMPRGGHSASGMHDSHAPASVSNLKHDAHP
jgi:sulfite exporter TauE/SafE